MNLLKKILNQIGVKKRKKILKLKIKKKTKKNKKKNNKLKKQKLKKMNHEYN